MLDSRSGRLSFDGSSIDWGDGETWTRNDSDEASEETTQGSEEGTDDTEAAAHDEVDAMEEDDPVAACAVCFEDLSDVGGAVPLPCDCRAEYCRSCWDRALNAKFDQTKVAQCPTCRCPLRVDFDGETKNLLFNKLPFHVPDPDMRLRIQAQTKPHQIGLLEQFGAVVDSEGAPAGPSCVCGSYLLKGTVRDRVLGFVTEIFNVPKALAEHDPRVRDLVEKFLNGHHQVPITCDICEVVYGPKRLDAGGNVWTCQGGNTTLYHGYSFDVCEKCYNKHVLQMEPIEVDGIETERSELEVQEPMEVASLDTEEPNAEMLDEAWEAEMLEEASSREELLEEVSSRSAGDVEE
jgi:hypothetical protein